MPTADRDQAAASLRDELTAENLARRFHEVYEKIAPNFGYETKPESAKPWDEIPPNNRALMVATADVLLNEMEVERDD
jgi:hypothetical protein